MAAGKSAVNLGFILVVSALALTAGISYYANSEKPVIHRSAMDAPASGTMPENHPDIDVSKQIRALEEMIAKDPDNAAHHAQIGNLYYDSGQYDSAAGHYRRSLALHPGDPNVETDLAVSLHYSGHDDEALEVLNNVLSYSPGFSHALFNKGIILINTKKDVSAGLRVWEELQRIDPEFARKAELEQKIRQLKEPVR